MCVCVFECVCVCIYVCVRVCMCVILHILYITSSSNMLHNTDLINIIIMYYLNLAYCF